MTDEQDRIARVAARLLLDGQFPDIRTSIDAARRAANRSQADCAPPSRGLVRRHLSAMQEQSLGAEEWARRQHAILISIEECLAGLVWAIDDLELRIAGRAAKGRIDGQEPVSLRLYSSIDDGDLCVLLEEQGFEITSLSSLRTRHGRLPRIVAESDELDLVLIRCHQRSQVTDPLNLVTGRPVSLLDVEGLVERIRADGSASDLSDDARSPAE